MKSSIFLQLQSGNSGSIESLRGSTTHLKKPWYSAVGSNAETSAKYQLSTTWWNE